MEWIRTSERVPDKDMDCLFVVFQPELHNDEGDFPELRYVTYGYFQAPNNKHLKKHYWTWQHPELDWECCVGGNVTIEDETGAETHITHWMPLPELPKK